MGPSEPRAPVQMAGLKPFPLERLTVQSLLESRHMKRSCLPSPFKSPTLTGPSEPQSPFQVWALKFMSLPSPCARFTAQVFAASFQRTISLRWSPSTSATYARPVVAGFPDHVWCANVEPHERFMSQALPVGCPRARSNSPSPSKSPNMNGIGGGSTAG